MRAERRTQRDEGLQPKTRRGKIMRGLLRQAAQGEAITQDTSTLKNTATLDPLSRTN